MRVDKTKNVMKVRDAFLENPLSTEREVAEKTWLSNWSVNNLKQALEQIWAKDEKIIKLTDWDFEMMKLIQKKKFKRLGDIEKPVDDNNLNQWDREAKARYSLFRWDATDKDWALKNSIQDYSTEELLAKLNDE